MKRLLLILLGVLPLLALAEPKVLVEGRLNPTGTAMVGSTVRLEVDLLVDTWFTAEPQLPILNLPGALVMPPSSEATHLTVQRDGETLFGLRFSYLITPNQAQEFQIPALTIQVNPGQGSGPVTVRSAPLSLLARLPEGVAPGQQLLVAQNLKFTQQLVRSQDALRVGDNLVRRLTIDADGAQAMLIPAPAFAEVDGLKRYVKTPQVLPLSDGRGGITGGRRVDEVSYVIDQAGHHELPAIELHWWDTASNRQRTSSVPAVEFDAVANTAYQAPFSIAEDLQKLGQHARVRIAQHWLLLAALVLIGGLAWYWGAPWWRRARQALQRRRAERQQAYLQSAEYAWRQIATQLNDQPAQLGAFYLWTRRSLGSQTLEGLVAKLPLSLGNRLLVFLRTQYGFNDRSPTALNDLQHALPELKEAVRQQQSPSLPRHGLAPLNPRQGMDQPAR
ncbi:BatD family protein [Pseudomonas sp. UL073]|uniref:BatD family protein n=1 Tax=Zestomonas insulae TaxID=2809017 RepID=A0ABS2II26_9GAMM|nr:BatD family protein [Pseudomonas insulae]MBM7061823.1 BatD family protein [Pseudomonas insulae]